MSTDPWHFQRWAFATPTGSCARKAVLNALAVMADTNTGRCEAKVGTISRGTEMGERSVRTHLKALAEAGLLARRPQFRMDGGRRGDEFLLLAPGVREWPDGTPVPNLQGGPPPATVAGAPSPSVAAQEQPLRNDHVRKGNAGASTANDPKAKPPPNFPEALRPHAREVMRVLTAIAEQHGCAKVWPLQVGRIVMAHPRHPLVAVAHEFAVWAVDPPRKIKSVVQTYQTFLRGSLELAALERLADDGTPSGAPAGRPGNVRPLRGGYDKVAEREARYERRKAAAQELLDEEGNA